MKSIFSLLCFVLLFSSCTNTQDYEINLKWNKAYEQDTFKRSVTGLKWALSYLGSTLANNSLQKGITYKDSIITLNLKQLGFSEDAKETPDCPGGRIATCLRSVLQTSSRVEGFAAAGIRPIKWPFGCLRAKPVLCMNVYI